MLNQIFLLHQNLIGDHKDVNMEARIFHEVSLITIVSIIMSMVVNFFSQIPYTSLILGFTLILTTGLYINSRIYHRSEASATIFCLALTTILIFNFFINSGSNGPTLLLFITAFFFSLAVMPKKQYPFWIILNVVSIIGLLSVEYLFPLQVTNSYRNRSAGFLDLLFTYLGSMASILVILSYIVKSLVNEKNKVLAMSKELRIANQSKTQLLSILSHDLRSPLNSIQSFLELLLEYDIDEKERQTIKASLLKETKNTQIMLHNLLLWTKGQMEGGLHVSLMSVPLYQELKVVLEILQISALEKVITIKNEINPDICIIADIEMIKVVVRNLISNAVKFTPSGGTITLRSAVDGDFVTLMIEDNGIGITEAKQEQLFSVGAESTYGTNNEKGVGLGLMLCKEFTELQGGTISFKSTIGTGSEFSLTFPLCPSTKYDLHDQSKNLLLKI